MALLAQVIVVDHLAVEALANDGALTTIITRNTHVHLLPLLIGLDVWVLETACKWHEIICAKFA